VFAHVARDRAGVQIVAAAGGQANDDFEILAFVEFPLAMNLNGPQSNCQTDG
jgi:hypothetical protein